MNFITDLIWYVFFFLLIPVGLANNSLSFPHNFYNAEILETHSQQLSLAGNYKKGISSTWDIGSQLLIFARPEFSTFFYPINIPNNTSFAPNFYFKHLLFNQEDISVVLMQHSFVGLDKKLSVTGFYSQYGATLTYKGFPQLALLGGLINKYSYFTQTEYLQEEKFSISVCFGADYKLTPTVTLHSFLQKPAWADYHSLTPSIEDYYIFHYYKEPFTTHFDGLFFLTLIKDIGNLSLEGGLSSMNLFEVGLFLNLYWKWS